MFLIVGLGNPGKKYLKTRHNFGFRVIDGLCLQYGVEKFQKKFLSEIFSGEINGKKVILVKPQTYMNRSGIAIKEIKEFHKITIDKIIVIHDDIDLELGKIKIKINGSNAGHNGLKSIDEHIGKNYVRLRLGIGRPKSEEGASSFVLKKFSQDEEKIVNNMTECITEIFDFILQSNYEGFLNKFYLLLT